MKSTISTPSLCRIPGSQALQQRPPAKSSDRMVPRLLPPFCPASPDVSLHTPQKQMESTYGSGPQTRNMTFFPLLASRGVGFGEAPKNLRHQLLLLSPESVARSMASLPIRPTVNEEEGAAGCEGPSGASTKSDSLSLSGWAWE